MPTRSSPGPGPGSVTARLHLGGAVRAAGWLVVDARPGPAVDVRARVTDLPFADGAFAAVYASHVYEHLGYFEALPRALAEAHRVLVPGGELRVSVPDLDVLARLFVAPGRTLPERVHVMRMMFGGQMNEEDWHHVGLSEDILAAFLARAGFVDLARVEEHGLFDDTSALRFAGELISLNVVARRGPAAESA
jgi:predicted SAM-dependent methyltransferase